MPPSPRRARVARSLGFRTMLMLAGGVATLPARAAPDPSSDRAAIMHALEESAGAWSRNDLAGFMTAYENASTTTYLKGAAVVHGYDAIQSMYGARFDGHPGSMGTLSLKVLEVRPLGPDYALCIGQFGLIHPATPDKVAHGMFTLVFHRSAAGWKIVADHTSS